MSSLVMQRAGFALPVTDIEPIIVRYASMLALMRDLRGMGATNALTERSRLPLRRAVLMRAAQTYAERFADADGRVRATFEIVWLSGWAPHASQQKPLAPGSARMKARVTVTLKIGILDPQGKAIEGALRSLGIEGIASVRQGKVFDVEVETTDRTRAQSLLEQACDKLLANTVVENYRVELI